MSALLLDEDALGELDGVRAGLRALAALVGASEHLPPGFQLAALLEAVADRLDPLLEALGTGDIALALPDNDSG